MNKEEQERKREDVLSPKAFAAWVIIPALLFAGFVGLVLNPISHRYAGIIEAESLCSLETQIEKFRGDVAAVEGASIMRSNLSLLKDGPRYTWTVTLKDSESVFPYGRQQLTEKEVRMRVVGVGLLSAIGLFLIFRPGLKAWKKGAK